MDNNKAYRIVSCGKKSSRRDYSKVSGKLELPNLVEIQTDSFKWFTQQGIQEVFEEIYPIENYGKKSTFASFLPGISGEKGIPIWCYYVNRGQCVVSFGVDNKDHSIMEFYPAHQAYQIVKTTGFRTFVKIRRVSTAPITPP